VCSDELIACRTWIVYLLNILIMKGYFELSHVSTAVLFCLNSRRLPPNQSSVSILPDVIDLHPRNPHDSTETLHCWLKPASLFRVYDCNFLGRKEKIMVKQRLERNRIRAKSCYSASHKITKMKQ
jgi:hypothetical protein